MIANFEATDNDFIDLRTLGKLQRKEVIAVKKDWRAKKLPKKLLVDQKVQERLYRWPSYEYFIDHSDLKLGLLHSLLNYLTICFILLVVNDCHVSFALLHTYHILMVFEENIKQSTAKLIFIMAVQHHLYCLPFYNEIYSLFG
jgi:hypothetical protein